MEFDVLQTYFDINVKMSCIKNNTLDYLLDLDLEDPSSGQQQIMEKVVYLVQDQNDGAIDKKNVLSVLLPNADDIGSKEKMVNLKLLSRIIKLFS